MNILMWILVFIGGTTGALSTLYIIVSLFAVIFYKIYRKVTCHVPLRLRLSAGGSRVTVRCSCHGRADNNAPPQCTIRNLRLAYFAGKS